MHVGRLRREIRHERKYLKVRMKETRMIVFGVKNPTPLHAGRVYALPREYARYLLMTGRATPTDQSRLRKTKEIAVPEGRHPTTPGKVLKLDQ
jgi:hypothetical protein